MKKYSVLVIDDEELVTTSMECILENAGYTVFSALNGEMGIEIFKKERPQMVITDLKLTGMSGIEVLRLVKEAAPETMVMILTGYGDMESAVEAIRGGASDFLQKPCGEDELLFRLENCFDKQEMQKNIATIKQVSQAKSEFLARMSHELRTPLNAILGFSQLLQISAKGPLNSQQMDSVKMISEAGKHLLALINEILEIEEIEAGRISINLESVDIGCLNREVLSLLEPLAIKSNIRLINKIPGDSGIRVTADRGRLRQIILNLVSNALKYNIKNGEVILSHEITGNRKIIIKVQDTGPGIPKNMYSKVFVPFERLCAENKSIEGTGIGLSITKKLVELMEGELKFSTQLGIGTCFYFAIPLSDENGFQEIERPETVCVS